MTSSIDRGAMQRVEEERDPEAVTEDEIRRSLRENTDMTADMIDGFADVFYSVEDARADLEVTGEPPATDADLIEFVRRQADGDDRVPPSAVRSVARSVADSTYTVNDARRDLEQADGAITEADVIEYVAEQADGVEDQPPSVTRQAAIETADSVTTVEDVTEAVDRSGNLYREDVSEASEAVGASDDVSSAARREAVERAAARELGAPSRDEVNRSLLRAADQSTTAREVVGDSVTDQNGIGDGLADRQLSLVSDQSGETVAVLGDQRVSEQVADELGVTAIDPTDAADELEVAGSRGRAEVRFSGRTIDEIEVDP